jgi:hypothetical protein
MLTGLAYWPNATGRSKSQMTQSQALYGEDEDSLPLLPRTQHRKLLVDDDDDDDDDAAPAAVPNTSRRRAPDSQAGPLSSALQPRTQRKARATSIASEDGLVEHTATSSRSSKAGASKSFKTGQAKKAVILLDDNDEEDSGVRYTASTAAGRSGAGTGSTGSGSSKRGRGQVEDQLAPTPASASISTSASHRGARSVARPSSSATIGKKKLLVDDDDDEDVEVVSWRHGRKNMQRS